MKEIIMDGENIYIGEKLTEILLNLKNVNFDIAKKVIKSFMMDYGIKSQIEINSLDDGIILLKTFYLINFKKYDIKTIVFYK